MRFLLLSINIINHSPSWKISWNHVVISPLRSASMMQLCSEAKKSPSSMDATQLLDSSVAAAGVAVQRSSWHSVASTGTKSFRGESWGTRWPAEMVGLTRNCILMTVHGSFKHDKLDFIGVHRNFIGFWPSEIRFWWDFVHIRNWIQVGFSPTNMGI